MSGVATRLTRILLLAGLAVAVTASSRAAASPARAPVLGVVAHRSQPARAARSLAAEPNRVSNSGPLSFDSGYESLIDRYFTDVAHDSGSSTNVYSAATQYSDGYGAIRYQATFGGSYVDHDPLPAKTCDDGQNSSCFIDTQLRTEIQRVLTRKGWHGGTDNLFFVMTPDGVGSCLDSLGGQCASNYYCAYHNDFTDSSSEPVLYANEPYQATISGCDSESAPNGGDADTTINTISHEQNEAVTDPFGDAWWANDGSEDEEADLCAWSFGAALGGSGDTAYNQVINGDHYWLQQEYSNADGGCVQHLGGTPSPPPVGAGPLAYHGGQVVHTHTDYAIYWLPKPGITTRPALSGKAVIKRTLTSSRGAWNGSPSGYAYRWQRCSAPSKGCLNIPRATHPKYRLTAADKGKYVRSTVRARNVNGNSGYVPSSVKRVSAAKH